jgi:beta-galactosidase
MHIAQDGVYAPSEGSGEAFSPSVEVVNTDPTHATTSVTANFAVYDGDQQVQTCSASGDVADVLILNANCSVTNAKLWSIQNPNLYRLVVNVTRQGNLIDSEQVMVGFRTTQWTGDKGFALNGQHTKLRGD